MAKKQKHVFWEFRSSSMEAELSPTSYITKYIKTSKSAGEKDGGPGPLLSQGGLHGGRDSENLPKVSLFEASLLLVCMHTGGFACIFPSPIAHPTPFSAPRKLFLNYRKPFFMCIVYLNILLQKCVILCMHFNLCQWSYLISYFVDSMVQPSDILTSLNWDAAYNSYSVTV